MLFIIYSRQGVNYSSTCLLFKRHCIITNYSYLIASIGSKLAAFTAGANPNMIPIPTEKANAIRTVLKVISDFKDVKDIKYENK